MATKSFQKFQMSKNMAKHVENIFIRYFWVYDEEREVIYKVIYWPWYADPILSQVSIMAAESTDNCGPASTFRGLL